VISICISDKFNVFDIQSPYSEGKYTYVRILILNSLNPSSNGSARSAESGCGETVKTESGCRGKEDFRGYGKTVAARDGKERRDSIVGPEVGVEEFRKNFIGI
jgi:hypothetical protein